MSIPAIPLSRAPYYRKGWHLNMKWTLEDMAFIESEAKSGVSAADIADTYEVEPHDIRKLCARNGIEVRG